MVGGSLEEDLLPVELEAEGGAEFDGADAEGLAHAVADLAFGVVERDLDRIEIRVLAAPQAGRRHVQRLQVVVAGGQPFLVFRLGRLLRHGLAFGVQQADPEADGLHLFLAQENARLDVDDGLAARDLRGADIKRMAAEIAVGGRDDQVDVAEQAAAGVPAGVERPHRVRADHQFVGFAIFHLVGDIHVEAEITVVRAADALAVEIDVADQHNALEVNQDALAFEPFRNVQGLPVPAGAEFLESAGGQGAAEIGRQVGGIALLVGAGCDPGLGDLEVVGQIDGLPAGMLLSVVELPAGVEAQGVADKPVGFRRGGGYKAAGRCQQEGEDLFHILFFVFLLCRVGLRVQEAVEVDRLPVAGAHVQGCLAVAEHVQLVEQFVLAAAGREEDPAPVSPDGLPVLQDLPFEIERLSAPVRDVVGHAEIREIGDDLVAVDSQRIG